MAGTYKQNMARLKLQEEIITNRLNLSPAEKRARIDQIDKARQETAERFMQRIREIESRS
jgi:Mg/Co/Ni transporter MgtE